MFEWLDGGEDKTEIKTGSPASLSLNEAGVVTRINLSGKQLDSLSLPMNVTSFDFEEKIGNHRLGLGRKQDL